MKIFSDKDKRVKGCPNEGCECNKTHRHFKAEDQYCVNCGTELVFVCRDCFQQHAIDDPTTPFCAHCIAKRKDDKEMAMETAAKVFAGAVAVGGGAVAIAKNVAIGKIPLLKNFR